MLVVLLGKSMVGALRKTRLTQTWGIASKGGGGGQKRNGVGGGGEWQVNSFVALNSEEGATPACFERVPVCGQQISENPGFTVDQA